MAPPGAASSRGVFVIDVFARRIVGGRVASSLQTNFVLDALEQAIDNRVLLSITP